MTQGWIANRGPTIQFVEGGNCLASFLLMPMPHKNVLLREGESSGAQWSRWPQTEGGRHKLNFFHPASTSWNWSFPSTIHQSICGYPSVRSVDLKSRQFCRIHILRQQKIWNSALIRLLTLLSIANRQFLSNVHQMCIRDNIHLWNTAKNYVLRFVSK